MDRKEPLRLIFAPTWGDATNWMREARVLKYDAWIVTETRDCLGLDRNAYEVIKVKENQWPKRVHDAYRSWLNRHERPTHVTTLSERDLAVLDSLNPDNW